MAMPLVPDEHAQRGRPADVLAQASTAFELDASPRSDRRVTYEPAPDCLPSGIGFTTAGRPSEVEESVAALLRLYAS